MKPIVSTGAKLDALREAARAHNIELSIQRVAKGEDIATAIDAASASGAEALNVLADQVLLGSRLSAETLDMHKCSRA